MLKGKTCFVTGGAQGLGLGIARACAGHGAHVAIADKDAAALERAKRELEGLTEVGTYELDVSDRKAFLAVADQVEQDLGPVHAVFNNAGVIDSVSPKQMHGELWDWVVGVNLHGVYNGVQAFVPRMIERGEGGLVVNVSSLAGLASGGSGFAYHATKYAVVGLTESLRLELAHHGISVSVVCPGAIATSIVRNTERLRPADAEPHTARVQGILDAAHERLLTDGVNSDLAGHRVVEGALAGQLFVFTDGPETTAHYGAALEQRTAAIVACLPGAQTEELGGIGALAGA